jgi:hypothetical protein
MSNTKAPSRKVRFLLYFSILSLMGLAVFQQFRIETQNEIQSQMLKPTSKESIPLKGQIEVFIDGKSVYKDHNVIQVRFYDALGCKMFNITDSCIGGIFFNTTSPVDLTMMELSSFTTGPISPVETSCPNTIFSSGLEPKPADTKTQVLNTNSIILTTSWVNTSGETVSPIGRVCLLARDYIDPAAGTISYASALFTPQSLANGAQITIQWTFSF